MAEGEMHVFYKVFEYENPPDLNLLNGFMTVTGSISLLPAKTPTSKEGRRNGFRTDQRRRRKKRQEFSPP